MTPPKRLPQLLLKQMRMRKAPIQRKQTSAVLLMRIQTTPMMRMRKALMMRARKALMMRIRKRPGIRFLPPPKTKAPGLPVRMPVP